MISNREREEQIQIILDRGYHSRPLLRPAFRALGRILWREMGVAVPGMLVFLLMLFPLAQFLAEQLLVAPAYPFVMSVPLLFIGMTFVFALKHSTGGALELLMSCKYTLLHLAAMAMMVFGAVSLLAACAAVLLFRMDQGLALYALGGCALMGFASFTLRLMRWFGMMRGAAAAPLCWMAACALLAWARPAIPPLWMSVPVALLLGAAFVRQILLLMKNQRNGGKELCC